MMSINISGIYAWFTILLVCIFIVLCVSEWRWSRQQGREETVWDSIQLMRVRQASLACPNLPHVIVQWISSACSPVKPASLAWSFLIRSPGALLPVWQTSLWACSIIINSTFKNSPFRIHHSLISLASAHFGVLPGPGFRGEGIMSQPCSVNKSPC